MSGTLVAMMYLPFVLAAVIIVSGVMGILLPYHAPPPAYTGDAPTP